ncbi:hypothetical protein OXX79_014511, partial [Metschnikowia pulcherrima]
FYYEALAHSLKAKQLYAQAHGITDDYREIDDALIVKADTEAIQSCVADARSALTQGYRVINSADLEASDPEVIDQVNGMLAVFDWEKEIIGGE